jgi:23S rRNA pseudouridine955/2504/2580 synthase
MRKIVVGKGVKPGTRLDAHIMSVFPALPSGALYKAFRKKDVKMGGKWAAPDAILAPPDTISVYLPDDILFGGKPGGSADGGGLAGAGTFSVVYEDERLLIVNKARGLAVHPDRTGGGVTLIELAREYLGAAETGETLPAMCHRIDRNTGGLVMIAKERAALDMILAKLAVNGIKREYRCIVVGRPKPSEATLRAYMSKDSALGRAYIYADKSSAPDSALNVVTHYRVLAYDRASGASKLEVSLRTGRTHQIRAHLAFAGHPIIGDGKYCPNAINRKYREPYQMLVAYRLVFPPMPGLGVSGRTIEIPDSLSFPKPT